MYTSAYCETKTEQRNAGEWRDPCGAIWILSKITSKHPERGQGVWCDKTSYGPGIVWLLNTVRDLWLDLTEAFLQTKMWKPCKKQKNKYDQKIGNLSVLSHQCSWPLIKRSLVYIWQITVLKLQRVHAAPADTLIPFLWWDRSIIFQGELLRIPSWSFKISGWCGDSWWQIVRFANATIDGYAQQERTWDKECHDHWKNT